MNPPIKLLSVASDFHCGSSVGLMPPAYKTLEGFTVKASPFQLWLWECWLDWNQFVKEVKGCDPMATVLNGDCTEGVHHGTKQIVSADHADHNGIAIRCLRPLADISDKLYIITGTEVHVGSGENSIGHALKAQINPDFPPCEEGDEPPAGAYTFQRLSLNLNGVRVIARHHMSTSIRRGLSGTPLSNALSDEQVEAVNNGEELPRVLLLAHSHVQPHLHQRQRAGGGHGGMAGANQVHPQGCIFRQMQALRLPAGLSGEAAGGTPAGSPPHLQHPAGNHH